MDSLNQKYALSSIIFSPHSLISAFMLAEHVAKTETVKENVYNHADRHKIWNESEISA